MYAVCGLVGCIHVCCVWSVVYLGCIVVHCVWSGRVYSCLLYLVGDRRMTDDCREKLMEVQYFVTRNFR